MMGGKNNETYGKHITEDDNDWCDHMKSLDFDVGKLCSEDGASGEVSCRDCRKNPAKKGRAKPGGKAFDVPAIWVCECGHLACGKGFPKIRGNHIATHLSVSAHKVAVSKQSDDVILYCSSCKRFMKGKRPGVPLNKSDREEFTTKAIKMIKEPTQSVVYSGRCVRGLVNLGNSCYFNSVVQNLLALIPVREYFGQTRNSAGLADLTSGMKGLINQTSPQCSSLKSLNPKEFFETARERAGFAESSQEDCAELLLKLLTSFIEEGHGQFINSSFEIQFVRTFSCCGRQDTPDDKFLSVTLSLQMASAKRKSRAGRLSVSELLSNFVNQDETCNECKKTGTANPKVVLKAPRILILQLFRHVEGRRKRDGHVPIEKSNQIVEFKEKIDLKPFMDQSLVAEGDQYQYQLNGIVEHEGETFNSGHYIAYVRGTKKPEQNRGGWCCANDTSVKQITLATVLCRPAYLLFYERMN